MSDYMTSLWRAINEISHDFDGLPDLESIEVLQAALSAMPPASRLALARALVPEMAVVGTKVSVSMIGAGAIAALAARETKPEGMSELGSDLASAFPAMLAAAEKETPDGP